MQCSKIQLSLTKESKKLTMLLLCFMIEKVSASKPQKHKMTGSDEALLVKLNLFHFNQCKR